MLQISACALPTAYGSFKLRCYRDAEHKEHAALVCGDPSGRDDVLVRIHSECFTGDVLGSHRCDCGAQLRDGLERIADEGCGVLVYLRQEGRGIGLFNKVRAYDLQDGHGLDTVDANRRLGFGDDERDYRIAAAILRDLGVGSVRLLSNNPQKEVALAKSGIRLSDVEPSNPVLTAAHERESAAYLQAKAARMSHRLPWLETQTAAQAPGRADRPRVVLSYAQSLDGTIATGSRRPLRLSGDESMAFAHRLRARSDAVLIGAETLLADDPRLTVRLATGSNPRPVVLDGKLRFPLGAKLLSGPVKPWIFSGPHAPEEKRRALEEAGARVFPSPLGADGLIELGGVLRALHELRVRALMVEGGRRVIAQFLAKGCVDQMHVTIAPRLLGGFNVMEAELPGGVRLENARFCVAGRDVILSAVPRLRSAAAERDEGE